MSKPVVKVFLARKIITINPAQPCATHIAVRDGKILSLGTADDVKQWGSVEIDTRFADKTLMPGFVEGHCHLMEGSMWSAVYVGYYDRRGPDGKLWSGLKTIESVIGRLAEAQALMGDSGKPLLAWGFDPIFFGDARLSAGELDRVSATRPIVVLHASVHPMNVNSAMLDLAEITGGDEIEGVPLGADGKPTGELQEFAAMLPVYRVIGQGLSIAASENLDSIWNFGRVAQLAGVTTATDLVNDLSEAGNKNLQQVAADPDYPVRLVPAYAPQRSGENNAQRVLDAIGASTDKLRFGLVKLIVDGSIQGFTARLRWPGYFNGSPNGLWLVPPAQLEDLIKTFHCAGLQLHIHTNGDEATEVTLDALERVLDQYPRHDHRHTLQHCQMADAAQFRRMAKLGLCVNLFANHIYYWGDAHYTKTMGPDRANRMDAGGSAIRHGVPVAFHSDAPITPLNPLFTAWCAMQRETAGGRILGESERITLDQALHAITLGAAYTLKLDHQIGSLEIGKFADFAVLEEDPLSIDPARLKDIRVWGTVVAGRMFEAPGKNG
jgi:predicted amidohydrolase YtcJ